MRRVMGKRALLAAAVAAVLLLGTLGVAIAGHENVLLFTELRGKNEVPTDPAQAKRNVGDPNGYGEAYVFGIDGDPTTLCYILTVNRIQTATAAHIHEGAAGTNGPVVVNLAAPADGNAADCLTEGEEGKFVGDQTVAEILANPSAYYVNVHNAEYPNGAIRGQLAPER
ncbi:MAG: CHRD domain-containing protein [Acidimicrobiia bacterium]